MRGQPGLLHYAGLKWVAACFVVLMLVNPGSGWAGSAPGMKVRGKVLNESGQPVAGVPVALLKILMQRKPVITSLKQVQTDQSGRFEFLFDLPEENLFFRVSAGTGAAMTGSDPFRLSRENPEVTLTLVLVKTLSGLDHLDFLKQIVVFEAMEEALQVTEVIYFVNPADRLVETGDSPFIKRIPKNAVNFQFFDRTGRFKALHRGEQVLFNLNAAPGNHQLLFSYSLPTDGRSTGVSIYLPPATSEFEILTPVNGLAFSLDHISSSTRSLSQEKKFDNRAYHSKTLYPSESQSEFSITIRNIPASQARLIYPAMILAAILVCGLLFYFARKPEPLKNGEI